MLTQPGISGSTRNPNPACPLCVAEEKFIQLRTAEIFKDPKELWIALAAYSLTNGYLLGMILMNIGCENDILRRAACAELSDALIKAVDQQAYNEWAGS